MTIVNRWDHATWDTNEVYDEIANNEGDYLAARRCRDVETLRGIFDGAHPDIDYYEVDWDLIFDTLEEE